jgi:hypothetical protein
MTHNGFSIYTAKNGAWKVVTLLANGMEASYDAERFTSQATATLYALKCHEAKPQINYAVRAA